MLTWGEPESFLLNPVPSSAFALVSWELAALGSVFSAFLPTVSLPFVVSIAGVSFFSTGLFFNFEFTVVTSLL